MTTFRAAIPDFQLANRVYAGATVSYYTVDSNGASTGTLATLYASPLGSITTENPQTLDADGKFLAPVYIASSVIGQAVGPNVASHTTGILVHSTDAVSNTQTGTGTFNTANFNELIITSDNITAGTTSPSINFVNGLEVSHTFGGTQAKGGRNAIFSSLTLGSATSGSNPYNFNCALLGWAYTAIGIADAGAYLYGAGATARVRSGSSIAGAIGAEFTSGIEATGTAGIRSSMYLNGLGSHSVKGSITDALLVMSNQASSAKWTHGLLFSDSAGEHAFGSSLGTLIGTATAGAAPTALYGIDLSAYAFATAAWKSPGSSIDGAGLGTFAGLVIPAAASLTLKNAGNTHRFSITCTSSELDFAFDGGAASLVVDAAGGLHTADSYYSQGSKVVGARVTGYTAMTGSPDKATSYATGTVTLAQLAGRVAQLQADLTTHGLIGA